MEIDVHMVGFEKENIFNEFHSAIWQCDKNVDFDTLMSAVAKISPDFSEGLFERRQCCRKLRYAGNTWLPEIVHDEHEFFRIGQIYWSTSFDGSAYIVEGYEHPVGYAFFELLDEE